MMLEFLLLLLSLLIRLLLLLVPTLMLMLIFATAAACSCFFRYWVNMTSSENQHHFPNRERKYIEIATTLSLRLIQPLSACFCSEFSLFCFVPTFIYIYVYPTGHHPPLLFWCSNKAYYHYRLHPILNQSSCVNDGKRYSYNYRQYRFIIAWKPSTQSENIN